GPALVLPGAFVDRDAAMTGGSVVHPGAHVSAGSRLDSAVVLPGARIGAGAVVVRSVVGRDARVRPTARLIDDVLGTGEVRPAPWAPSVRGVVPGAPEADRHVEGDVHRHGRDHLRPDELLDPLRLSGGDLDDELVVDLQEHP